MRLMMTKIFLLVLLTLAGSLAAKQKYALGLYHFNLQYVAGDYRIENRIIRESLYPALQFFEKNPQYKADIEIQGYAIEVLGEEHPKVLALLKKLVDREQVELVVAHYSDQFFIAYPAIDLQRSVEISEKVLAKYHLKRSKVFFGQEIQWSPGLASALYGKFNLIVTSSDPNGYYRGKTQPLVNVKYGTYSMLAIIGGGQKNLKNVEWTWAFLDDGEVFNSTDYNSDFYFVPEQEKKNIDRYKKLESEGFQFVTMSEFADVLKKDPDYRITDYPFVPEGTWNMGAGGPFLWMGEQRSGVETDGITRALCYQARGLVLLAEKLIAYAEKSGIDVSGLKKKLQQAWEHLLLAEVSDSSGWSPWLIEVRYTADEVANTKFILSSIFDELKKQLNLKNKQLRVPTGNGSVETGKNLPKISTGSYGTAQAAALPIENYVRAKKYTTDVKQIRSNLFRVDFKCRRPADGAVEITFRTAKDNLQYSAGCGEESIVDIPTDLKHNPILALSNGFIYLGNGYSLIKDCSVEHLAATWKVKEQLLVFREELNENNPQMQMRFYILKGTPVEGHALANRLNTWPTYLVNGLSKKLQMTRILPEME